MPPARILLASNNPHKLEEISRALGAIAGAVVSPQQWLRSRTLPPPPDPVEDGRDYLENATIKAIAFSRWSGLPALADDSGLEVAALGGRPGLYSARYAGDEASFTDNNRKLLGELDGIADAERGACFICVMALCDGDQRLYHTEGICPGSITQSIRGERGFGYDPIFVPEGESRTFAELSAPEKDCISHRGRALSMIRQAVRDGRFPIPITP